MWPFLKNLGILIAKISCSAARQTTQLTTHDAKSKQVTKKLKESDRNEEIELHTVLFDEKSFEYQRYNII